MSLRTPLSKARGLGSAKEGLHHWLAQRVSAVALLLLSIWFITALLSASSQGRDIVELVSNPLHAVAFVLFLGTALYHGALGVQVVIEDYVHCECAKNFLLIAVKFVAIVTAVAAILAILTFHVNGAQKHKRGYGERPCAASQSADCHKKPCDSAKPCHGEKKHYGKKHWNKMKREQGITEEMPAVAPLEEDAQTAAPEVAN